MVVRKTRDGMAVSKVVAKEVARVAVIMVAKVEAIMVVNMDRVVAIGATRVETGTRAEAISDREAAALVSKVAIGETREAINNMAAISMDKEEVRVHGMTATWVAVATGVVQVTADNTQDKATMVA